MAIGSLLKAGATSGAITNTHPCSVKGQWITAHDNLSATAETSTVLLKPYSATTSTLHWVRVPDNCTRVYVRGKNTATMTGVTTQPVVRIIGAYPTSPGAAADAAIESAGGPSGTVGNAGHCTFGRIDNADANATGLTLAIATTGNLEDDTYEYTDWTAIDGYDLRGASYVAMLTETAASVSGIGNQTVYGELMFL